MSNPGKPQRPLRPCSTKKQTGHLLELGNDYNYIGVCHCEVDHETEYSESIDTNTLSSIDSMRSPTTDVTQPTSTDVIDPVNHYTLPDQCYPQFAFDPPTRKGYNGYSIGSWADNGFHESLETVVLSSDGNHSEEYDEDYWKEYAIEMSLYEDTCESPSFNFQRPSIDKAKLPSIDANLRPAIPAFTTVDAATDALIDIKAATLITDLRNIPIPYRLNPYIKCFAPITPPQNSKAETTHALTDIY